MELWKYHWNSFENGHTLTFISKIKGSNYFFFKAYEIYPPDWL